MKRILLTGFDPVRGINDTVNPSYEIVKQFVDEFCGAEVIKLEVPTEFIRSKEIITEAIEKYKPDIVLSLGVSPSRCKLTLERIAINVRDGDMKDNAGYAPQDEKIFKDGENAYFSNLPIREIVNEANKRLIPMSISSFAGTYGCNQVMYTALYLVNNSYPNMKAGFLHIPYFPEHIIYKENTPSLPAEISKNGVEVCLEVTLKMGKDSGNEK